MNVSMKFISRYVDLPADLTYDQIAYDLTMRTVEVEDVINTAAKFHDIVVGEIKEVKAHPNADALKVCIVDVGEDDLKQIVCGGSNLTAGHRVCVAKPGSEVVWHGEGEPVKLKETKLRGVSSYGMICGATEVYLADIYPPKDEREIVDFTDLGVECEVGQCVAEAAGVDDVILEIDNKSLSNRPDLWGHYGVARELAAIYKVPFNELSTELPEGPGRSQNGCRMGDFGPPSSSRLQAPQSSAFHAIPHLVRPSFPITPDDPPPRPTLPSRKTLSSPFLHPSAPFSFLPNMFHSASDRGAPFQMLSETCWEENTFQGCSLSLTIFSN